MIFRPSKIQGAFIIEAERHIDDRGSFARVWCARELKNHGLCDRLAQSSISSNTRKGTLRGMHYSVPPHAESKVVRCIRGGIYDVLLDLRADSSTYMKWFATILTQKNATALYVPEGVAHGFQTIEDDSDVLYQISEFYDPACARGVRWNDPAFGLEWPEAERIISDRDQTYASFPSCAS
jgi:dTDP-4-dehydrorhamnose 3,5-epimerase